MNFLPSSGCPPRSGAPGYSYICQISYVYISNDNHPVEIHAVESIFPEETQQIGDELGSIASRRNHVAENRLRGRSVVIECPAAKGNNGFESAVLLLQIGQVREE